VDAELIFQEVLAFHPEMPDSAPAPQVTSMEMDDQEQDQEDSSLKMSMSSSSTPVQFMGMVSPGSGFVLFFLLPLLHSFVCFVRSPTKETNAPPLCFACRMVSLDDTSMFYKGNFM